MQSGFCWIRNDFRRFLFSFTIYLCGAAFRYIRFHVGWMNTLCYRNSTGRDWGRERMMRLENVEKNPTEPGWMWSGLANDRSTIEWLVHNVELDLRGFASGHLGKLDEGIQYNGSLGRTLAVTKLQIIHNVDQIFCSYAWRGRSNCTSCQFGLCTELGRIVAVLNKHTYSP